MPPGVLARPAAAPVCGAAGPRSISCSRVRRLRGQLVAVRALGCRDRLAARRSGCAGPRDVRSLRPALGEHALATPEPRPAAVASGSPARSRTAPDLRSLTVNDRLIVASGKTPTTSPSFSAVSAARNDADPASRSTGMWCMPRISGPLIRCLKTDVLGHEPDEPARLRAGQPGEDEVQVADVVAGEHRAARARDVLSTGRRSAASPRAKNAVRHSPITGGYSRSAIRDPTAADAGPELRSRREPCDPFPLARHTHGRPGARRPVRRRAEGVATCRCSRCAAEDVGLRGLRALRRRDRGLARDRAAGRLRPARTPGARRGRAALRGVRPGRRRSSAPPTRSCRRWRRSDLPTAFAAGTTAEVLVVEEPAPAGRAAPLDGRAWRQRALTAATTLVSESLASPKSSVVFGS